MRKTIILIAMVILQISAVSWNYEPEKWTIKAIEKYWLSENNLWKKVTRKDFVNSLYWWYDDYKKDRWVKINYKNFEEINNQNIFTDVDLSGEFWKKLSYFASIWAFAKNKQFNPNWTISQKDYFTVMRRLWIMQSLRHCKNLKICEKEATKNSPFLKWTYYKYTSKIMDRSLRKYFSSPSEYIKRWYKPYLNPNYRFPLLGQSLNSCYAFTVRNILKYKHNIWVYVQRAEKYIWKNPSELWWYKNMAQFDKVVHVSKEKLYTIDSLISSLQAWEPVSISYILKYKNWKWEEKTVWHIVAAYSFDEEWIWVSETVANKRIRLKWDEVFNKYWYVKYHRMFRFKYENLDNWTNEEKAIEKENNFLYLEK